MVSGPVFKDWIPTSAYQLRAQGIICPPCLVKHQYKATRLNELVQGRAVSTAPGMDEGLPHPPARLPEIPVP